jgi:DNA-binding NarL/FixJ family response regulator
MSTEPIRIIIGDDHPLVADALHALLDAQPEFTVVAVTNAFADLVTVALAQEADVVILDLAGMHTSPWAMLQRLQREVPRLKIVIYSSMIDLAPELFEAGAVGYVVKQERSIELINAVRAVAAGSSFRSPHVEEYFARSTQKHPFTPQEMVTLKLLAKDFDTEKTAEYMAISQRGVQNNVSRMLRKKGFSQRSQLISWYRRMYGSE